MSILTKLGEKGLTGTTYSKFHYKKYEFLANNKSISFKVSSNQQLKFIKEISAMDSKISIVFISLYLLKCVSGTSYYEITSATGETSIQPFFSLSPEAGIVGPAITGGGIGLVLGAILIGCCNLFGTKSVTALKSHAEEEDETEVKPAKSVVPADNSTNSTKTAKTKRSINNYQARIISAAETPGKWY